MIPTRFGCAAFPVFKENDRECGKYFWFGLKQARATGV
jgi:hypothetical protein